MRGGGSKIQRIGRKRQAEPGRHLAPVTPRVDDVRFVGRRHLDAIAFDEAET
jgi:hypothetical protein